jgi:hypothetical protein
MLLISSFVFSFQTLVFNSEITVESFKISCVALGVWNLLGPSAINGCACQFSVRVSPGWVDGHVSCFSVRQVTSN